MAKIRTEDGFSGPQWEAAIYTSRSAYDQNGRTPENVSVDRVADALSDIGVNHRIYYDLPVVQITNDNPSCDSSTDRAYDEWRDYLDDTAPFVAADSNMLLIGSNGGGCAAVDGNWGVAGSANIDHVETRDGGTSSWFGNVYSVMHEIGHNMGFQPDGNIQYGETWVEGDRWHKTPCIGRRDASENVCNDPIEPDPSPGSGPRDFLALWYADCVAQRITIRDPPVGTVTGLDAGSGLVEGVRTEIEVEFTNRTPTTVNAEITVAADQGSNRPGGVVETIDVSVSGFDSDTWTVGWTPEATGTYTITAGEAEITRTVESGGSVRVTHLDASPGSIQIGDSTEISVTLRNTTSTLITETVDVNASLGTNRPTDDVGSLNFAVPSGESRSRSVEWEPPSGGTWAVAAGDAQISVDVSPAGQGAVQVVDVSLPGGTPTAGDSSLVTIKAENPGDSTATRSVTVRVDGRSVGTVSFDLDPGDQAFRNVSWTPESEGQSLISAGGTSIVTDVEPGGGGQPLPDPGISWGPAAAGGALLALFFLARPEGG